MEMISAATRKTVPKVSRRTAKLRSSTSCHNKLGGLTNEVGVIIMAVMLLLKPDHHRRSAAQNHPRPRRATEDNERCDKMRVRYDQRLHSMLMSFTFSAQLIKCNSARAPHR